MDRSGDKRDLYNGFGNGLARAFELAVTPAIFGGLGFLVDRVASTTPVFTIAFLVFALAGMFVRMWFGYDAQMRVEESRFTERTYRTGAER